MDLLGFMGIYGGFVVFLNQVSLGFAVVVWGWGNGA